MEITGRVISVLPKRTGTRKDGTAWTSLPFIFEYFRNPLQTYADRVMLEAFDGNIIAAFERHMVKGPDGQPKVNEYGHIALDQAINCAVEIGHRIRTYEGRTYNEVRLMNFRVISNTATATSAPAPAPAPAPSPQPYPQQQPQQDNDDLPF